MSFSLQRIAEAQFKGSSRSPSAKVKFLASVAAENSIPGIVHDVVDREANLVALVLAEVLHQVEIQAMERHFENIRIIGYTYDVEFFSLDIVEQSALPSFFRIIIVQADFS